jgi:protein-S-isoprenylcysteine O-methyltransferase Ste14
MQFLIDVIITAVSSFILLGNLWAVRRHFSSPKTPPGAALLMVAITSSSVLLLILTWAVEQPLAAQLCGVAIELLSAYLFGAAVVASRTARLRFAFDPAQPHGLLQTGPYRWVRHPFYTSYLLLWTGWSIADWSPLAIIVPPVFLVIYWRAARMEERNFAASALSESYKEYRKRVGFFFPRLLPRRS